MSEKLELTSQRKKDLQSNKTGIVRGKPLRHSVAIESRYIAVLMRMTNQMIEQTSREIKRIWKQEGFAMDANYTVEGESYSGKWGVYRDGEKVETLPTKAEATKEARALSELEIAAATKKSLSAIAELKKKFASMFSRKAKEAAETMLAAVTKESAVNLAGSLKELSGQTTVKADFMSKPVGNAIRDALEENVALIKSIPDEYATRIVKKMSAGVDTEGMARMLELEAGIAKRRSKNIALDQARKAYSTINTERLKSVGVERFEWVHSGGGQKPRRTHILSHNAGGLNGGIYDMKKGAYDADADMWIMPAQLPNCKCTMVPVIEVDE